MQNLYQRHTQAGQGKVSKMPGHIKKTSGPDPDPSPWLQVTPEMKANNAKKVYGEPALPIST